LEHEHNFQTHRNKGRDKRIGENLLRPLLAIRAPADEHNDLQVQQQHHSPSGKLRSAHLEVGTPSDLFQGFLIGWQHTNDFVNTSSSSFLVCLDSRNGNQQIK